VTLPLSLRSPIAESVSSASMASSWPCSRVVSGRSVSAAVAAVCDESAGSVPSSPDIPINGAGDEIAYAPPTRSMPVWRKVLINKDDSEGWSWSSSRKVRPHCLVHAKRYSTAPQTHLHSIFEKSSSCPQHNFLQPMKELSSSTTPLGRLTRRQDATIFSPRRCTKRHSGTLWDCGQLPRSSRWVSSRLFRTHISQ
jgi:hypothetical protein